MPSKNNFFHEEENNVIASTYIHTHCSIPVQLIALTATGKYIT
jgi:hypothetical protein